MDSYAWTLSVEKGCMLVLKHRNIIGCDANSSCMTEVMLQLLIVREIDSALYNVLSYVSNVPWYVYGHCIVDWCLAIYARSDVVLCC